MMVMHMAYGMDMIALASGTALMLWSMKNPGKGSWFGKLIGALIVIFSIISIVCMVHCGMNGGQCHSFRGEGMMMGAPADQNAAGEEHMKKGEHKKM